VQLATTKLEELTAGLREAAIEKKATRLKGIGHLSSELLDREIGDWNRFGNRRQVASYTGLCPGEDSSGDSHRSLSIDKHGNPRVRAVLVELAWLLPRYQPDYKPLARWKWLFDKGNKASGAMKKKAMVALARRLAVDLWRIKTGRADPVDLGLKLAA
jgi:transposase